MANDDDYYKFKTSLRTTLTAVCTGWPPYELLQRPPDVFVPTPPPLHIVMENYLGARFRDVYWDVHKVRSWVNLEAWGIWCDPKKRAYTIRLLADLQETMRDAANLLGDKRFYIPASPPPAKNDDAAGDDDDAWVPISHPPTPTSDDGTDHYNSTAPFPGDQDRGGSPFDRRAQRPPGR